MKQEATTVGEKLPLIATALAEFAAGFDLARVAPAVERRAKLLMLDAIGVAFASTRFDFARCALDALRELGPGEETVIGMPDRLSLRDAVMMNAILVHGIDYDDTYLPGSVHLTASCVPVALGLGGQRGASGAETLAALTLGLEVDARLGLAGNGGFLRSGFHATSVLGTFACTLIAGRLMGLTAKQLAMAQGIALSMASGNMQPMQDGSWTKRMHPGWAGVAAVTAATFARHGFVGPSAPYEGRFGLYPHFLGEHFRNADLDAVTRSLGEQWEFPRASIKLYPACHQSHAFMNATRRLAAEHAIRPDEVESITALIAEPAVPLICEPLEVKRAPDSSYGAQFSLPYGIACCITRGRFGLEELEEASYTDAGLRRLAAKVSYEIDPNPGFPRTRSGEVIVRTRDGRELSRRENLLPDEPATEAEIVDKFMMNVAPVMSADRARTLCDIVLGLEQLADVRALNRLLGSDGGARRG